jgi:hypothetical protein
MAREGNKLQMGGALPPSVLFSTLLPIEDGDDDEIPLGVLESLALAEEANYVACSSRLGHPTKTSL